MRHGVCNLNQEKSGEQEIGRKIAEAVAAAVAAPKDLIEEVG